MLTIWSLVPLAFLNPACTSGSSRFMYCWSLACKILSITLLAWNECNCVIVWTFFGIALPWDWNENWSFPVLWPLLSFPNCWHTEHSTLTASSLRIWNSSAGISSLPLALFVVMFPKVYHVQFSSVQFSLSVMSSSLRPHESQHARPPCPSPTPGVHSNSRPSSQWCHPAISPSVVPFSSCPQSLPASESFPTSQFITWGGQSTGVSALASFLPKNTQDWSPLEWTGWTSLQSKGLSRVFSNTTV